MFLLLGEQKVIRVRTKLWASRLTRQHPEERRGHVTAALHKWPGTDPVPVIPRRSHSPLTSASYRSLSFTFRPYLNPRTLCPQQAPVPPTRFCATTGFITNPIFSRHLHLPDWSKSQNHLLLPPLPPRPVSMAARLLCEGLSESVPAQCSQSAYDPAHPHQSRRPHRGLPSLSNLLHLALSLSPWPAASRPPCRPSTIVAPV